MKVLKIIILFTLILVLSFISYKSISIYQGLPQYEGRIALTNLESKVETTIDKWGIPHLNAKSEKDLYRAFGFYMAQERLFQMDIHRRLATGRLSEVFGDKTLSVDKLFRTLGLAHYGKKFEKNTAVALKTREAITAYFDGINQFIKTNKLPPEYHFLGLSPEPFKPYEAYAFLGYMAYSFGIGFKTDLLFNEILTNMGKDKLDSLRSEPRGPSRERTSFVSTPQINLELKDIFGITENFLGVFEGSNAWVLGPKHSNSGGVLFASDPHISFSLPGTWLEAHLKSPNFEIFGQFLPLVPFAAMGFNQRFGWGLTVSYIDDMDFFQEKVNLENETYKIDDKDVLLVKRNEVITIKGAEDISLKIYETRNGPILDPIMDHKGLALKWTYHLSNNNPFEGLYQINHSKNIKEFEKGINLGTAPGLNVIYADKEGNMARFIHGAIPLRRESVASDIIIPGNESAYQYLGYLKNTEKPIDKNPASQRIISANFRPEGSDVNLRGYWQPIDRYKSIDFFLQSKKSWDIEEFKHIQTAPFNVETKNMINELLNSLNLNNLNKEELKIIKLLREWNGVSSRESVAATIYYEWLDIIGRMVLDELNDDLYNRYCVLADYWVFLKRIISQKNNLWWDIKTTEKLESRDLVVEQSFKAMLKSLKNKLGAEIIQWKWEKVHTLTFRHAFGMKSGLGEFFNLGPYGIDGSYNSVSNFRRIGCEHGFQVKSGPSSRRVVDFSDIDHSFGILPIGNSGNMFSEFFDNQLPLFLEGDYRPNFLSKTLIKANLKYFLEFIPEKRK